MTCEMYNTAMEMMRPLLIHARCGLVVQAGGGAAGFLIVEDPPGSLPAAVEALEEMPLLITHFDVPTMIADTKKCEVFCQDAGGINCTDHVFGPGPSAGQASAILLVNGMYQPKIRLVAGRWYRWRLAFAAVTGLITPALPSECEMGLLAKDGIYLHTAPRTISAGCAAARARTT